MLQVKLNIGEPRSISMSTTPENPRETSRAEDYRDFEERDIDEGWPYPDRDAAGAKRNEAYGRSPAGLESDGNAGTEVADAPAIQSGGGPAISRDIAHEAIEDDGLEETISNLLADRDDLDAEQITVRVLDGVVELSGSVETVQAASLAERIADAVPGVGRVRNQLVLTGVDSNIPEDANG
jgi:hypothetical protein